jgi:RNA polymerase sigma factor for flagellar operon FliA
MPNYPECTELPPLSRDARLTAHLGLVRHVARKVSRTLSIEVEFDELVSAGTMGLMTAIDAFDASLGHAFSSFAAPRIRGAMLDALRQQDHVPRTVRRRAHEVAAARNSLAGSLGRVPRDAEIASRLGVDVELLWSWQQEIDRTHRTSIHEARRGNACGAEPAEGEGYFAELATAAEDGIEAHLERVEYSLELHSAIAGMKDQECIVVSLHYFAGLPMCQIAPMLGVTGSRVSQIHKNALRTLRMTLDTGLALAA